MTENNQVKLWDLTAGKLLHSFPAQAGDILIHYCVLHETRFVRSRYEYRLPPFRIFNGSSHRRPLRSDLGSGGELMN